MSWDKCEVGYFVSTDKVLVETLGPFPTGYMREESHFIFY